MDAIQKLIEVFMLYKKDILDAIAYIIAAASIIIKLTPTLKDDNYLKPIIKFIGKYLAIDKYSPPEVK